MEASQPRKAGDIARMFSIPIQAKLNEQCKVRFFYHMFGKHVDSLKVFVLKVSTGTQTQKFSANGDLGDMWKLAEIDLSKETEPFRMVFEGRLFRAKIIAIKPNFIIIFIIFLIIIPLIIISLINISIVIVSIIFISR